MRRLMVRSLTVVAAVLVASALLGPGAAGQARVPNPDVLFWGVYWEPVNLDPHAITDLGSLWMLDNTYETLVRYKTKDVGGKIVATADIQPHLAESVEVSPDSKVYTFKLRSGVRFHSGDELTADVVKYSINRMLTINLGPARLISQCIDGNSTEALDRQRVRITLRKACPFFLKLLAGTNTGAIVNPKTVEAHGGIQPSKFNEWMSRNVDGTGAFKWGRWTAGEQFDLVANDQYWGGAPKLKRVSFRVITDFATQLLLLRRGELDIVYRLPPNLTTELIGKPDITLNRESGIGIHEFWMNVKMKPFDDVRVRRALTYAIDPFAINRATAFGLAKVAKSLLPSALEGWSGGKWPYTYDPAKAKALLAEAGYPNGFKFEIYFNSGNGEREQTAIAIQAMLRKVGVEVEIRGIPWGTYVTNFMDGKMPTFVLSNLLAPIVEDYLLQHFHSKSGGPKGNYSFYANAEVDQLIDKVLITTDPAQRKQMITRIQEVVNGEVPSVPIYESLLLYAQRSWVKGWVLYPSGNWYFERVEKRL